MSENSRDLLYFNSNQAKKTLRYCAGAIVHATGLATFSKTVRHVACTIIIYYILYCATDKLFGTQVEFYFL